MSHNNITKKNAIFFEFLGWLFFIFVFIVLIRQISELNSWNSKKDNYFKEYVYSEFGTLYYESDGKRIYIQKIYNIDNNEITIQVPNNETILMYISKDNINEGIYFNDSLDLSDIFIPLFLMSLALVPIQSVREIKRNGFITLKPFSFICLFLFVCGTVIIVFQVHNIVTYFNIKSQNNTATATIYSQVFTDYYVSNDLKKYEYVAHYYVDGEKYIYVDKIYVRTYLNNKSLDILGDTFEIYYDESNPNQVIQKSDIFNFLVWIFGGIFIVLISFPFLIFGHKLNEKIIAREKMNNSNVN